MYIYIYIYIYMYGATSFSYSSGAASKGIRRILDSAKHVLGQLLQLFRAKSDMISGAGFRSSSQHGFRRKPGAPATPNVLAGSLAKADAERIPFEDHPITLERYREY